MKTINRTGVVRWLESRHGLTATEGLLRHYESIGLLRQEDGASTYEARALAILRARRDGTPLPAIAQSLGVAREEGTVTAIDQPEDDDDFLRSLDDARQSLLARGISPTQATLKIFAEDREAWARYRRIVNRAGNALVAREGA